MLFVFLENNLQVLSYIKSDKKSCCYLLIIYTEKGSLKEKTDKIFTGHTTCNLHLYYNFAPVLHEKWANFSQSEVHGFFIYFNILEILLIIFRNGNLWGNINPLPPFSFLFLSLTPFVQTSPAVRIKDGSHDFHQEN